MAYCPPKAGVGRSNRLGRASFPPPAILAPAQPALWKIPRMAHLELATERDYDVIT